MIWTNSQSMLSAPRARIAGAVYLLYLGALDLAWILVARRPFAGRAALLLSSVLYLILGILFYSLFKPVSRRISRDAALFCIGGSTLGILHIFRLASQVSTIPLLAVFYLLTGYLILRSTFLPRILGWLMVLAGLGWLAYMKPAVAALSHGHMSDFSFLVEGSLALWLFVKGVDLPRWQQQADAAKGASLAEEGG